MLVTILAAIVCSLLFAVGIKLVFFPTVPAPVHIVIQYDPHEQVGQKYMAWVADHPHLYAFGMTNDDALSTLLMDQHPEINLRITMDSSLKRSNDLNSDQT